MASHLRHLRAQGGHLPPDTETRPTYLLYERLQAPGSCERVGANLTYALKRRWGGLRSRNFVRILHPSSHRFKVHGPRVSILRNARGGLLRIEISGSTSPSISLCYSLCIGRVLGDPSHLNPRRTAGAKVATPRWGEQVSFPNNLCQGSKVCLVIDCPLNEKGEPELG